MVQKASKGQELHKACDTEHGEITKVMGVGSDMILTKEEQEGLLTNCVIPGESS